MEHFIAKGAEVRPFCSAVVAAAGSSSRMQGEDKLFIELNERPVLVHSLMALEACPDIDEIVVTARSEDIWRVGELAKLYGITKLSKVVCGGENRMASVYNGLMETDTRAILVAVHDAARPLATPELMSRVIGLAAKTNAAIPAVPIRDTVKVVRDGMVASTPIRAELMAAQTPQVFESSVLKAALTDALAKKKEFTDDCAAVEALGVRVHIAEGDNDNIKITTPEDIPIALVLLERRLAADE